MPKITPKIPKQPKQIKFSDLKIGDCFLLEGTLFQKTDGSNQGAVCFQDGATEDELCEFVVIPVDVEIKWTKKK